MSHGSAETQELARRSPEEKPPEPGSSALFNVGAVLDGGYEVIRLIGRGGMGWVVEVERLEDGARLALKYCDSQSLSRKRLMREARILGSLRHPHLVPVLDAWLDHDPPYFVMPLAADTLEFELRSRGGDTAWAIQVFRQVCLGVQALHQAGVTHRDLKPANVLLLADDRHVVADLGTAKREPRDSTILTRTCAILGTLCYLAPEQMMPGGSRQANARTDVFQLGKMLYQMITGRSPVVVETASLPPALGHIIVRATSPRPEDRYPDVAALLEAVETFQSMPDQQKHGSPTQALEALVTQLQGDPGRPLESLHQEILAALAGLAGLSADVILDAFDRLPVGLLAQLARSSPVSFRGPLAFYALALEKASGRRPFDYADQVAARMRAVFDATPNPEVQVTALRAMLVAAVVLNRYAAMDAFKRLLYAIRSVDLAILVAEMLRDHSDYFQEIAPSLRVERVHPILLAVINDLDWIQTVSF